jgi:ABC-type uncharacterized transport system fused permease/ATPase subunit
MILDEALSALEPALEDRIRANLTAMLADCTVLIVSHRVGSTAQADTELRIEKGQMVTVPGCGTPSVAVLDVQHAQPELPARPDLAP